MIQSPRPHRMMPVKTPQILQRIAADNATRALRNVTLSGVIAAQGLYDPAPVRMAPQSAIDWSAPAPSPKPAPFYVNVYQLSPGRHFLGAPSAGPIYSSHAVYRLRVTPKVVK